MVQGVLPAGAAAALHLTYNATALSPGQYTQNLIVNSNDLSRPHYKLKVCILRCACSPDLLELAPPFASKTHSYAASTRICCIPWCNPP